MRQPPHLVRAQTRMAPGVITIDGFLGNDHRPLLEILQEDDGAVRRLDLTHGEIARALERLTEAAEGSYGTPVREGPFELAGGEARGRLPCPFGHPGLFNKTVVKARRVDTGEELTWTALQVHLIAVHGFYEGSGSPFRAEPETLARFLGLLHKGETS